MCCLLGCFTQNTLRTKHRCKWTMSERLWRHSIRKCTLTTQTFTRSSRMQVTDSLSGIDMDQVRSLLTALVSAPEKKRYCSIFLTITHADACINYQPAWGGEFMHDGVSGLVSQHTEVLFCTNRRVKKTGERGKGTKGHHSGGFSMCVWAYYPLLLIVGLQHRKQSCSTKGTKASNRRQTRGRKFVRQWCLIIQAGLLLHTISSNP